MNLVDCYITEVLSCQPYKADWAKGKNLFKVTYIANCYGQLSEYSDVIKDYEIPLYKKGCCVQK